MTAAAARPRRTRPDRNQRQLVRELRAIGMVVWDVHDKGGECLDLIVCWRGRCVPVEVKASGHEADLTAGELQAIRNLGYIGVRAIIATSAEDVVAAWEDGV